MKIFLFFSITLLSFLSFSQHTEINSQHGYAADGYDVVTYFSNKAIKGDKKFTTTYQKIAYKFVSQENLTTFIKNPEKYIPQYGGWCAYAMGKDGSQVKINPETFEIIEGKLYLFYNAFGTNTLKKWKEEGAEQLKKQADEYWLKQ